ncbi:hypothetical protein [Pseudobacteroides cellulosolvens]|uniref:Uncharacterized protein n=1 Tax=Pseudobacteroides cellulosolvens ATCC 35603 = DSM 2933 TaxID=398512 RepID=A0A0L6JML8_9FIRM|nr:hypothetical protein [Pseudobacteroides cellulosolvens]KNY27041.1 hypothetical protein Bccel_2306 [Pseudobacteroides cellulosolvens ATCC 35603 = DSM 2933]
MGIHYVYISIGIGTLILNAVLIYFYIRTNKPSVDNHIAKPKNGPQSFEMDQSTAFDEDDFTMDIDGSKDE